MKEFSLKYIVSITLTIIFILAVVFISFHQISTNNNNYETDSQSIAEGYNIITNFLKQKNFKIIPNSLANASIFLPSNFNYVKNGVNVGEILKHRNKLSKQNNFDFSTYMGKRVSIYTAAIEPANNKSSFDVVFLIADNKIIGYWIDPGKMHPKQYRTDFILLKNF